MNYTSSQLCDLHMGFSLLLFCLVVLPGPGRTYTPYPPQTGLPAKGTSTRSRAWLQGRIPR